jgi:hypothetical protein
MSLGVLPSHEIRALRRDILGGLLQVSPDG